MTIISDKRYFSPHARPGSQRHRARRGIEGRPEPPKHHTRLSAKQERYYGQVERARMAIGERQMPLQEEKILRWRLSQIDDVIRHADFHGLNKTILESINRVREDIDRHPHKSGHHFEPMAERRMK